MPSWTLGAQRQLQDDYGWNSSSKAQVQRSKGPALCSRKKTMCKKRYSTEPREFAGSTGEVTRSSEAAILHIIILGGYTKMLVHIVVQANYG